MTEEKINILVVDDLPENLLVMDSVLKDLGQNVIAARSGPEALRRVLENHFAVILLDVNMPDMDGYETAKLIRQRKKSAHTPIIFITAYADEVHTVQGYTLGAVDFILSPVVPEILRTKVQVFVDLFRMTQQVQRQAEEQVALAREQAARSAAEETVQRLNFLAEASNILASSLDLEATLRGLLGLVVPRQGDLGIITLSDEQGVIRQTELAWVDPVAGLCICASEKRDILHGDFTAALQQVIAKGKPEYLPSRQEPTAPAWRLFAPTDDSSLPQRAWKSLAILPLMARGRALGALTLAMERVDGDGLAQPADPGQQAPASGLAAPPAKWGEPADLALIEDLAHRAAIAIDNAQLYRDIQEADRRKNEFLSMLAHELRNPLAPLLNGIQILRLHGPKHLEVQKVQDMMDRQVHHLVRLVDDLLDISRITRDKIQLHIEPVSVAAIVDRAVEVSRPLLDARGQAITITLPAKPFRVNADPIRLAQVLSNLLNNAAKFTQKGGKVWLTVEQEGSEILFRVRDNGIGIPAEMLGSVFDLFTQVERSLDRSQGGLGIGLTLVRRLVEMHGGSVQASSAGPQQGSEFIVRLPARAEVASPAAVPDHDRPVTRNGRHRILVVDDNIDAAESTAMLLQQIGLEVKVIHDGPGTLTAVQTFQPEIVLLDIGLPGMDGYEVARRLRQQPGPHKLLLVALSGYGQEEDRQRSREAGFDHHLVKPATLRELQALFTNARAAAKEELR